ncbi:unnamed protein product [Lota lota]
MSDYDNPYSEDRYSSNQYGLIPHNHTEKWSGLYGNTSLGALPVGLSTSHHHDQQERKEEQQWLEEGEEILSDMNGKGKESGLGEGKEKGAGEEKVSKRENC